METICSRRTGADSTSTSPLLSQLLCRVQCFNAPEYATLSPQCRTAPSVPISPWAILTFRHWRERTHDLEIVKQTRYFSSRRNETKKKINEPNPTLTGLPWAARKTKNEPTPSTLAFARVNRRMHDDIRLLTFRKKKKEKKTSCMHWKGLGLALKIISLNSELVFRLIVSNTSTSFETPRNGPRRPR